MLCCMVTGNNRNIETIWDDRVADVLDKILQPEWGERDEICILRQEKPSVWKMLPVVDIALVFADPSLPDNYRHAIILWLRKLTFQIEKTGTFSPDVKDEEELPKDEEELLQHKKAIQEVLEFSLEISTKKDKGHRNECLYKQRLLYSPNLISALKALINKFTSGSSCWLDIFYESTNGHWPKVKTVIVKILSLIVGALIATALSETCRGGKAAGSLQPYRGQMEAIEKKIQSVFDKCKSEFKANMLKDLEDVLDLNVSNDTAVYHLNALMSHKYDWLVAQCNVCDESINLNYCCLKNHVKVLERNGKFGVISYDYALN